MASANGKMRMNVEGDRLSTLPDDLIHKILSSFDTKEVMAMSALSTRWRYIWTSTPNLSISTQDFSTLPKFSKFVTQFLTRINKLTDLYSLKLSFRPKVSLKVSVQKILDYAFSHNVQQLEVIFLPEKSIEFPLSLFSSRSLKHLTLRTQHSYYSVKNSCMASTWELPALTTLVLHKVTLDEKEADKFFNNITKCANLKNLTLKKLHTGGLHHFSVIHSQLSNLTIEQESYSVDVFKVVAPQLKNLIVSLSSRKLVVSAPCLVSLVFKGSRLKIIDGFHSLEKADICYPYPKSEKAHKIVCLLQHLHNVQFLTLNLELVELLSSSVELLMHQPSPFMNLKSLNIHPHQWSTISKEVTVMCNELKSYFLDNSSGSTFTMVLREEVKAQELMDELGVHLKKEKDDTETSSKLKIGGDMAQIKSCLDTAGVQIEKACVIISKLQDIEDLLTKLPASKRAKLQPCFSSLCEEADNVVNQITDGMKIQCDEDQDLSSVCFQMNLLEHWRHFLSNLSVPYSPK